MDIDPTIISEDLDLSTRNKHVFSTSFMYFWAGVGSGVVGWGGVDPYWTPIKRAGMSSVVLSCSSPISNPG
jgi:hypothetical protein